MRLRAEIEQLEENLEQLKTEVHERFGDIERDFERQGNETSRLEQKIGNVEDDVYSLDAKVKADGN